MLVFGYRSKEMPLVFARWEDGRRFMSYPKRQLPFHLYTFRSFLLDLIVWSEYVEYVEFQIGYLLSYSKFETFFFVNDFRKEGLEEDHSLQVYEANFLV